MAAEQIKPIETVYNGYRFRSRLEARWAVFLDAMGIKWDYELEGYKLPSGYYLPDFFLHDFDAFLEIKPNRESWNWNYLYELAKLSDKIVLCSDGMPSVGVCGDAFLYCLPRNKYEWDDSNWPISKVITEDFTVIDRCHFALGRYADGDNNPWLFIDPYEERTDVIWCKKNKEIYGRPIINLSTSWDECYERQCLEYSEEEIDTAIAYAKQARFEHGEKP